MTRYPKPQRSDQEILDWAKNLYNNVQTAGTCITVIAGHPVIVINLDVWLSMIDDRMKAEARQQAVWDPHYYDK